MVSSTTLTLTRTVDGRTVEAVRELPQGPWLETIVEALDELDELTAKAESGAVADEVETATDEVEAPCPVCDLTPEQCISLMVEKLTPEELAALVLGMED